MKRMLAIWVVVAVAAGPIARAVQTQLQGPAGSGAFGSRVLTLTNGNIVVGDPYYSVPGGPTNAGAAYLYNGKTLERISMLTGSQANDYVGYRLTALSNGHYVVQSVNWHNGSAANAGAATWCSGTGGLNGVVSPANSLVGSAAGSSGSAASRKSLTMPTPFSSIGKPSYSSAAGSSRPATR